MTYLTDVNDDSNLRLSMSRPLYHCATYTNTIEYLFTCTVEDIVNICKWKVIFIRNTYFCAISVFWAIRVDDWKK